MRILAQKLISTIQNTLLHSKSTRFALPFLTIFTLCQLLAPATAFGPSMIKEVGGLVLVDVPVQVNGSVQGSYFELVRTSTPTTPSTNHARIWLETTDGDLKVIFDNGTSRVIAAN